MTKLCRRTYKLRINAIPSTCVHQFLVPWTCRPCLFAISRGPEDVSHWYHRSCSRWWWHRRSHCVAQRPRRCRIRRHCDQQWHMQAKFQKARANIASYALNASVNSSKLSVPCPRRTSLSVSYDLQPRLAAGQATEAFAKQRQRAPLLTRMRCFRRDMDRSGVSHQHRMLSRFNVHQVLLMRRN